MGRVSFLPSQLGEGTPSPENVRPIVPGLVIESKNLLRFSDYTWTTGWYLGNTNGTNGKKSSTSFYKLSEFIPCERFVGMDVYTDIMDSFANKYAACCFYTEADEETYIDNSAIGKGVHKVIPSNAMYMRFATNKNATVDDYYFSVYEEDLSYEPYYEPITIYGGYVDFDAGEVVEEWTIKTIDGTENFVKGNAGYDGTEATNRYFTFTPNSSQSYLTNTAISDCLDSKKTSIWTKPNDNPFCFTVNGMYQMHICLPNDAIGAEASDDDVTRTAKFKAYLTEHNIQISYPLRYPSSPHTLTPSQLTQAYNQLVKVSPVMLDRRRRILMPSPHLTTASGQLATFQTDLSAPLKEMKVHFSPVQASGTPSPDNVLPISGWDGVTVWRTGKNLFANANGSGCYVYLKEGITYTISYQANSAGYFRGYDENREPITGIVWLRNNAGNGRLYGTITPSTDIPYCVVYRSNGVSNVQIEYGSTPTDYEPYTAQSIPITFQQTIYGGYVDLVKGEVVEEYGIASTFSQYKQNNGFIAYRTEADSDSRGNMYCNMIGAYGSFSTSNMTKNIIQRERVGGYLYLALDESADVNDLRIVYTHTTPITYPLTPQTMKTRNGINNIFSDANGNVDVTYWKH